MTANHPPACSLEAHAFQERVTWIAALNRQFLRAADRHHRTLVLTYDAAAIEQVEEMMRRERGCCAFLEFDLKQGAHAVLTITVPAHAAGDADQLLAPFYGPHAMDDSDSCCGACTTPPSTIKANGATGTALTTAGAAVLACSACCVLPLALPVVAATAAGGVLAWLGRAHMWMTGLAVVIVVVAWLWIWRQSVKRNARIANATLGWMGVASLAALLAVAWPKVEPALMRVLI